MSEHTPDQQAEDKVWTDALGASPKREFAVRVFKPSAAMVKKKLENGHRMWTRFDAEKYSKEEWDLIEGMWDHEHCAICSDRIDDGDFYWVNSENHILCLSCHEKFQKRG